MGAGRKPKLNEALIKRLSDLIRVGNYIEIACSACGISKQIFHIWMRDGAEARSGLKKELFDSIKEATALSEARDVIRLDKLAESNVAALTWRLSRRFPQRWGQRESLAIEHSGPAGGPIQIEERRKALIAIASNPETRSLLEQLAKAMAPIRNNLATTTTGDDSIDVEFGLVKSGDNGI